jgi:hypothetical protein
MEFATIIERIAEVALAAGVLTVVLRIANRASDSTGWAGIWIAVAGGVAIWAESVAVAAVALAVGAGAALFMLVPRARRTGRRLIGAIGSRAYEPWNHEAELVKLCHGDESQAERLIEFERRQKPNLSRAGAALAAATRLRHDRN